MIFGIKIIKLLLFSFNFIFAIFGIAILSLGVLYKLQIESITSYLGNNFPIAPDLFIAIGTLAFVISFFGCIGASRENRYMLITFVVLLVILLIIELVVVIIAFVEISNKTLETKINNKIIEDLQLGNLGAVENKIECCGIIGPKTYENLNYSIPITCYKDGNNSTNPFQKGCFEKILNVFHNVGTQLGAIAISVAILEIIGTLFAFALTNSFRDVIK